jgi:hypothetical protein
MRQLQTCAPFYVATAEWIGDAPGPIPPDTTYCFVDVTDDPSAQLGQIYDPVTQTWSAPPPPVTVLRIKKTAFIDILTPTEYVAMLGPQTDPQLAWGVGLYDAASDPFLTEDPQVEMMLNYCASTGVLTQARANQIYAEMIAASKSYQE